MVVVIIHTIIITTALAILMEVENTSVTITEARVSTIAIHEVAATILGSITVITLTLEFTFYSEFHNQSIEINSYEITGKHFRLRSIC